MSKGKLFIISGPSGSGKDTVLKQLFKIIPDVGFSISCITRPMREGERQDEKYHFISKEQFSMFLNIALTIILKQFIFSIQFGKHIKWLFKISVFRFKKTLPFP